MRGFWPFLASLAKTRLSAGRQRARSSEALLSATLPCHGLSLDSLALRLRRRHDKTSGCIFCDLPKLGDDAKAHIVHRGQHCYVILNTFPYTPGHVMIVPFAHLDELQKLPVEAAHEMMDLSQRMERVLRQLYTPDGVNLGMNIGKAAGAGVAGHIHMHVLPRWVADANFMSVVGETRMLPESLEMTYERIKGAMEEYRDVWDRVSDPVGRCEAPPRCCSRDRACGPLGRLTGSKTRSHTVCAISHRLC